MRLWSTVFEQSGTSHWPVIGVFKIEAEWRNGGGHATNARLGSGSGYERLEVFLQPSGSVRLAASAGSGYGGLKFFL